MIALCKYYLFRVLLFVKLGSIRPKESFSPEEALHNLADVQATDVAVGRNLSLCQQEELET